MTYSSIDDALQDCLERVAAGANFEEALARHPEWRPQLDGLVAAAAAVTAMPPERMPEVVRVQVREALQGLERTAAPTFPWPAFLVGALIVAAALFALNRDAFERPAPPAQSASTPLAVRTGEVRRPADARSLPATVARPVALAPTVTTALPLEDATAIPRPLTASLPAPTAAPPTLSVTSPTTDTPPEPAAPTPNEPAEFTATATDAPPSPTSLPTATATLPTMTGIAGVVTDAEGLPLPGALVEAAAASGVPVYFVTAAGDGQYFIETAAGDYLVRAEADGYEVEWYPGASEPAGAATVVVALGAVTTGIDFSLAGPAAPAPTGTATTTVTAYNGAAPVAADQFDGPHQEPQPWTELVSVGLPDLAPPAPLDIALTSAGLYVADAVTHSVILYDDDGNPIWRHSLPRDSQTRWGCVAAIPVALEPGSEPDSLTVLWACYRSLPEEGAIVVDPTTLLGEELVEGMPRSLVAFDALGGLPDLVTHPARGLLATSPSGTVASLSTRGRPPSVWELPQAEGDVLRVAITADERIAAAYPDSRAVRVFDGDGLEQTGPDVGSAEPLAIHGTASGGLQVFVRPDEFDETAPVVLEFDAEMQPVGQMSAAELGLEGGAGQGWPWAMAALDGNAAVTAGEDRFIVVREAGQGQPIFGASVPQLATFRPGPGPGVDPDDRPSDVRAVNHAVDTDSAGRALVLDEASGRIAAIDDSGAVELLGGLPGAIDLAVAPDDSVFVVTSAGQVAKLADATSRRADWKAPCSCSRESRIALAGAEVLVSQPRHGSVSRLRAADGGAIGAVGRSQPLWPTDITGAQDWLAAYLLEWTVGDTITDWRSGLVAGPRRVDIAPSGGSVVAATADGYLELHNASSGVVSYRGRAVDGVGRDLSVSDAALDDAGRVWVIDAAAKRLIALSVPDDLPEERDDVVTGPGRVCQVAANRQVAPLTAAVGTRLTVTVTVSGSCPGGAPDGPGSPAGHGSPKAGTVLLLVDRSASMAGPRLAEALSSAGALTQLAAAAGDTIGLASFADSLSQDLAPDQDPGAVLAALDNLLAAGGTQLGAAVGAARGDLPVEHGTHAAIVLVSDGEGGGTEGAAAVAAARSAGVTVVGLPAGGPQAAARMAQLLGDPGWVGESPSPAGPFDAHRRILADRHQGWVTDVTVNEPVAAAARIRYEWAPEPLVRAGALQWHQAPLPAGGVTVTYAVTAMGDGAMVIGDGAEVVYTDADGRRRSVAVPTTIVNLALPTITPLPSPTPTATSVARPRIYLPTLLSRCPFVRLHVTLVLPTDGADSLARRIDAARAFLGAFDLRRHSVGLVSFNRQAELLATGRDAAALLAALDRLQPREGGRLDLGLAAAASDMVVSGAGPGVRRVIVVLGAEAPSDGVVRDGTEREAARIRGAGAEILVVTSQSEAFLERIASRVVSVPPAELAIVADTLARSLRPCGPLWAGASPRP